MGNKSIIMNKNIIGAHVSTAGGLHTAIKRGSEIGVESIQIFGSSPRTWRTKIPTKSEVDSFHKEQKKSQIQKVFLHAAYLVNIASANDEIYRYSIQSLIDHLTIAEMIGAEGLIFHIGSSKGISEREALKREVSAVKEIIKKVPGRAKLIMENTAGGGDKMGQTVESFAELFNKTKNKRLGICFDTAHAFEAGWMSSYSKNEISEFFKIFDKKIGLKNLSAFHINDSMTETASHHDRHANIGMGKIGIDGFKNLASKKELEGIPWILEVPGFDGQGPDKKNVKILEDIF